MVAFLFSCLVLVPPLILTIILQGALVVGAMWAYDRFFEETDYGDFRFDAFSQASFAPVLGRVAGLVGGAYVVLHFLLFVLTTIFLSLRIHFWSIGLVLMVLVFGCLLAGLQMLFSLDGKRAAAIAALSALPYLLLFWILWSFIR